MADFPFPPSPAKAQSALVGSSNHVRSSDSSPSRPTNSTTTDSFDGNRWSRAVSSWSVLPNTWSTKSMISVASSWKPRRARTLLAQSSKRNESSRLKSMEAGWASGSRRVLISFIQPRTACLAALASTVSSDSSVRAVQCLSKILKKWLTLSRSKSSSMGASTRPLRRGIWAEQRMSVHSVALKGSLSLSLAASPNSSIILARRYPTRAFL